jgi:hyperosmotically inducible periplasmic protein
MWKTSVVLAGAVVAALTGCSSTSTVKAPDVADGIRQSLRADSTMKDVSVSDDRDKGVVTLTGHVPADPDKARAESIARSMAGGQVVSNEIAVLPPGVESEAKTVNADWDKGIEKNLDAALIMTGVNKDVKYRVKNGVVTLTGNVDSETGRREVARVAGTIPNVSQVVNEVQVKNQKATSN